MGQVLPVEVVDVGVHDVRRPAAEEDDRDGRHQDVGLPTAGVDGLVLGLRPKEIRKKIRDQQRFVIGKLDMFPKP